MAAGWRRTARSSSSITTGGGVGRDLRKAKESEWWRRGGFGLKVGFVFWEGSGLRALSSCELDAGLVSGIGNTTGRGICSDSLLALQDVDLDLGRNFQPRGSGPVMTDVGTGGGEEQEEVEDDEEEEYGLRGVE